MTGGQAISAQAAPWAVFVRDTFPGGKTDESFTCSGTIIDASHILTVAHCLFDRAGNFTRPAQLRVEAGVSNFRRPRPGDVEQRRFVTSTRVDPGYVSRLRPTSSDRAHDIAVLTLSRPLDLSTPGVQAVPFAPAKPKGRANARVVLAGFGETSSHGSSGPLVRASFHLLSYRDCPMKGILCGWSQTANPCAGDSGAGLLIDSAHPQLVALAVASACRKNTVATYVDVTTASAQRFIRGSSGSGTPPKPPATRWVPSGWASAFIFRGKKPTPLVFALPRAWLASSKATTLIGLDPVTSADVRVGIDSSSKTRSAYFARARAKTVHQYLALDPSAVIRSREVSLPGARALEISTRLQQQRNGHTLHLLIRDCLVFDDGVGYQIRYTTLVESEKTNVPIFEESLQTVHFVH